MRQGTRLDNASFSVGNMYHLAHIADDTFDLVHVHFLAGIVEPQAWTSLFKELLRVCRPGGAVCWSEWGELLTNSPACNEGYKRLQHALALAGATTKVTLLMKTLLEEQECGNVQQSMVTLDFSVGTAGYTSFLPHMQTLCYFVESLLERMGLGEVEELAQLERQVWLEVLADSFYATWPMATVWGRSAHNRV
jgi:SAM-dependent methyltransferase